MPRYIDADALIEDIQETICAECCDISDGIKCKSCGIDDTLDFLENAPTADVAPKSEVAREIIEETFERIKANFVNTPICKVALSDLEYELKKKYTEDKNDN